MVIKPELKEGKWNKNYIPDKENGKYSSFTYDLEGFLALLKYCLFNTHLTFGGEIYRQFQGIAMGANSSTFIANMFLEAYELKFWEQLAQAGDRPPTDHDR